MKFIPLAPGPGSKPAPNVSGGSIARPDGPARLGNDGDTRQDLGVGKWGTQEDKLYKGVS